MGGQAFTPNERMQVLTRFSLFPPLTQTRGARSKERRDGANKHQALSSKGEKNKAKKSTMDAGGWITDARLGGPFTFWRGLGEQGGIFVRGEKAHAAGDQPH